MSKVNLFTNIGKLIESNLPAIFTGLAIGGVIITGITGYIAARKTDKVIAEVKESKCEEPTLTIIKKSWKYYVPVVASAAITIGAVIGLNVEHKKAYAALLAAYTATQGDLKNMKEEVEDILGVEKAKVIEEKVYSKRTDESSDDLRTRRRIRDAVTGMEMVTTKLDIRTAADCVNQYLASEAADGYAEASYAYFLDNLGYEYDDELPVLWKHVGWKVGGNNPCMSVKFDARLDEHGDPILIFYYGFDYVDVCDDDIALGREGITRHSYIDNDDSPCKFMHTVYD